MSEPEAARQRKIEEIRHTGKTWQWPDPAERPKRSRGPAPVGWMLLAVAALAWLIWGLTAGYW